MSAGLTLEHVLDEDAALSDLLVNNELLIVGCDEENHGCVECVGLKMDERGRYGIRKTRTVAAKRPLLKDSITLGLCNQTRGLSQAPYSGRIPFDLTADKHVLLFATKVP